jgi:predicted ATPase
LEVTHLPTLIVVSGPSGTGKTTLAHKIALAVGCPAICRDEIKEGMVHATRGFTAAPGDDLTARTFPTFFAGLAQIRIVHCTVSADIAIRRSLRRSEANPVRRAHADPGPQDAAEHVRRHEAFDRVSIDAPWIEVDTTDGYRPGLPEIVAFVNDLA